MLLLVTGRDHSRPRRGCPIPSAAFALLAGSLLVVMVAACSGDGPVPSTGAASASASGTPTASVPTSPPLAAVVDIGDGRQLYVQCTGSGSPTVVFESGDEDDTSSWRKVLPGVVARTRACAYDRLGNGQSSDPVKPCRGLTDLRGDFEAVLRETAAQPPYILVGASGGGYLMAGYAMAHPENVAGMVLVDTPRAVVLGDLPKAVREGIRCGSSSNQEHRDFAAIEHEVWDHRRTIGDIPVTVVSNDYGNVTGLIPEQRTNVEDQRGWLVLSPSARQVMVASGHDIPGNEAILLTGEILKVLQLAQASR